MFGIFSRSDCNERHKTTGGLYKNASTKRKLIRILTDAIKPLDMGKIKLE